MVRQTRQFGVCRTIQMANRCNSSIQFETSAQTNEKGKKRGRERGGDGGDRGRWWPSESHQGLQGFAVLCARGSFERERERGEREKSRERQRGGRHLSLSLSLRSLSHGLSRSPGGLNSPPTTPTTLKWPSPACRAASLPPSLFSSPLLSHFRVNSS